MDFFIKKLSENEKFKQYLADIKNKQNPISLSGLTDVAKTYLMIYNILEEVKKEMLYIFLKRKYLLMIMNHKVKICHLKELEY